MQISIATYSVSERRNIRDKTTDPFNIWGQPQDHRHQPSPLAQKDQIIAQERQSQDLKNSSPYRRLKLVMDYWCALWFWPINQAELLPDRSQYFFRPQLAVDGRHAGTDH